jgi:hypothetical protein
MSRLPGLRMRCPAPGVGTRDAAEYRREARADQGAGAGIARDGAADGSQARSGGCVADDVSSATENVPIPANTEEARRRAIGNGTIGIVLRRRHRGNGVEPGLPDSPSVTFILVTLLPFLALTVKRISVDTGLCGRIPGASNDGS